MATDPRTALLLPGFGAAVPAPAVDTPPCGSASAGGCEGGGGGGCGGSCGCSGDWGCAGATGPVAMQVPLPRLDCADTPWAASDPEHTSYGNEALDAVVRALQRVRRRALQPLEQAEQCPGPAGSCYRVLLTGGTP